MKLRLDLVMPPEILVNILYCDDLVCHTMVRFVVAGASMSWTIPCLLPIIYLSNTLEWKCFCNKMIIGDHTFGRVLLSGHLSVFLSIIALTLEPLDPGPLILVCGSILTFVRLGLYVKVLGQRSMSKVTN